MRWKGLLVPFARCVLMVLRECLWCQAFSKPESFCVPRLWRLWINLWKDKNHTLISGSTGTYARDFFASSPPSLARYVLEHLRSRGLRFQLTERSDHQAATPQACPQTYHLAEGPSPTPNRWLPSIGPACWVCPQGASPGGATPGRVAPPSLCGE